MASRGRSRRSGPPSTGAPRWAGAGGWTGASTYLRVRSGTGHHDRPRLPIRRRNDGCLGNRRGGRGWMSAVAIDHLMALGLLRARADRLPGPDPVPRPPPQESPIAEDTGGAVDVSLGTAAAAGRLCHRVEMSLGPLNRAQHLPDLDPESVESPLAAGHCLAVDRRVRHPPIAGPRSWVPGELRSGLRHRMELRQHLGDERGNQRSRCDVRLIDRQPRERLEVDPVRVGRRRWWRGGGAGTVTVDLVTLRASRRARSRAPRSGSRWLRPRSAVS
jgi:hypothetical protein